MKKRIMLTTPNFYSYPDILKKAFQDIGFEVVHFSYPKSYIYMPVHPLSRAKHLRWIYSSFRNDFDDFSKYCIGNTKSLHFDYLLSINIPVSGRLTSVLKRVNSDIKTIIYLWDSLYTYRILPYTSIYDSVITFDFKDAIEFGLKYKINFWTVEEEAIDTEKCYDLVFVGKFSNERVDNLIKIMRDNPTLNCYFRLFSKDAKKHNFQGRWLRNRDCKYADLFYSMLTDEIIPISQVNALIRNSKCIVDYEIRLQYGLSQRAIFALAHQKKVITTNPYLLSISEFGDQIFPLQNASEDITGWLSKPINSYALYDDICQSEVHNWITDILE
jgi:hypothetical protein